MKYAFDRLVHDLRTLGFLLLQAINPKYKDCEVYGESYGYAILVNAQRMALKHPETFEAPCLPVVMQHLRPGDFVKVCLQDLNGDHGERFWLKVGFVLHGHRILATVDNFLIYWPIETGKLMGFEKECLYEVKFSLSPNLDEACQRLAAIYESFPHSDCDGYFFAEDIQRLRCQLIAAGSYSLN